MTKQKSVKRKILATKLPPDLIERLRKAAFFRNETKQSIIERALERELSR